MRQRPVGDSAVLLECRDSDEVEAWRAELWRLRAAGALTATEIVPGERTILLDGVRHPLSLPSSPAPSSPLSSSPSSLVEVPVVFDGEDLDFVGETWGVPPGEVVCRLREASLIVAFSGFAPGFGYLRGLPPEWSVPRLPAPRPRVPAGSVALAGHYAGIYPSSSPGGWRLVGHTTLNLFDVRREHPSLLSPGTRVRLVTA